MNISDLIDEAKARQKLPSDTRLARALDITATNFKKWRKGWVNPADETLCKLCELAGVEPLPWLLWLNVQRTRGEPQSIYQQELDRVLHKSGAEARQVIAAE